MIKLAGPRPLFPILLAASLALPPRAAEQAGSSKWEKEIAAFEAANRTSPPPRDAILFIDSSSIRMWKSLAEDFKELPVINRGFGGSQMADSVQFADRIVMPCRPRQVVVYAGDNDLAAGRSPEQVFADFQALVKTVHASLPNTRITCLAIKPSPKRWALMEKIKTTNRLIAEFAKRDERLAFIDTFTPILGPDGRPREELFKSDKLHLNEKGYAIWVAVVRPFLK